MENSTLQMTGMRIENKMKTFKVEAWVEVPITGTIKAKNITEARKIVKEQGHNGSADDIEWGEDGNWGKITIEGMTMVQTDGTETPAWLERGK